MNILFLNLKYGGLLKLNCKNFIQNDYIKLPRQKISIKNYFNYNLSYHFLKQKLIFKNQIGINQKKNFINDELESNIKHMKLDYLSSYIIKKFNWVENSKIRIDNFNLWLMFAENNKLNSPFKHTLKHNSFLTPWCLPIIAKNGFERERIIDWIIKNNYLAFSWTSLPKNVYDPTAIYLSKNIICFSTYLSPKKNLNDKI